MLAEVQKLSMKTKSALTAYYFRKRIEPTMSNLFSAMSLLRNEKERQLTRKIIEKLSQDLRIYARRGEMSKRDLQTLCQEYELNYRSSVRKLMKSNILEEISHRKSFIVSYFGFKILSNWKEIVRFVDQYHSIGKSDKAFQTSLEIVNCEGLTRGLTEGQMAAQLDFSSTSALIPYLNKLEDKHRLIRKSTEDKKVLVKLKKRGKKCRESARSIFSKIKEVDEALRLFFSKYEARAIDIVQKQIYEIRKGIENFHQSARETLNVDVTLSYETFEDRVIFYLNIGQKELVLIDVCFIIPPRVVILYSIIPGTYFVDEKPNEFINKIINALTLASVRQSFHSPWTKYTMGADLTYYIQSDLPFDNITRNTIYFILESVFQEVFRFRKEIEPRIVSTVLGNEHKDKKLSIADLILLSKKGLLKDLLSKKHEVAKDTDDDRR